MEYLGRVSILFRIASDSLSVCCGLSRAFWEIFVDNDWSYLPITMGITSVRSF